MNCDDHSSEVVSPQVKNDSFPKTASDMISDLAGKDDNVLTSATGANLNLNSARDGGMLVLTIEESPLSPLIPLDGCFLGESETDNLSIPFDRVVRQHNEDKATHVDGVSHIQDTEYSSNLNTWEHLTSPALFSSSGYPNNVPKERSGGSIPMNDSFSSPMLCILSNAPEVAKVCVWCHN